MADAMERELPPTQPPSLEITYPPEGMERLDIQRELHLKFADKPIVEAIHIGALWSLSARHHSALYLPTGEYETDLLFDEYPAVVFDTITRQVMSAGYLDEPVGEPECPFEILHQALCEGFALTNREKLTPMLGEIAALHLMLTRGDETTPTDRRRFGGASLHLRRVMEGALIKSIRSSFLEPKIPIPDESLYRPIADKFLDPDYFRYYSPLFGQKPPAAQRRSRLADQIKVQHELLEAECLAQAKSLSQLVLPRLLVDA